MKLMVEKLPDLRALYINQLRLLLSAEEQLEGGLKRMTEYARDSELKKSFEMQTSTNRIRRKHIEGIVSRATRKADSVKCKAVSALIDEAEDLIHEVTDAAVREAGLIAVEQKVCHYQIAAYGTARQFANALALQGDVQILDEIVRELSMADRSLSVISEQVNLAAARATH
jgi:ferritin-like metal-binding protein YciE